MTPRTAYVNLYLAIRDQAESDEDIFRNLKAPTRIDSPFSTSPMAEFEEAWVRTPAMGQVFRLLAEGSAETTRNKGETK